ncbi:MAG: glycyl-tRNA synthetase, alpha subunit [Candidatus Xenolissoclinum pacificiensis L6]|uniref:Glycine--tRNA ligase alpha subunit n=1 Tax=Candidatus Xenolissoclinum pacificiensis L6 TaxID=1401685 RepID=W2UY72_9RICK|nr:MAG: glycyl-tRNA synthetase, alpha subunit [Candidatus Xenolissoclinum pacificiensis L6]
MITLQEIIHKLDQFWQSNGCTVVCPYTTELGAATLHPATVFGGLRGIETRISYVQPVIRPTDGRTGCTSNRLYRHTQYQVLIAPPPENVKQLYFDSLRYLGMNTKKHDIRLINDNWEHPSIGAYGVGWEVWYDGMEITQLTYMQQLGTMQCKLVPFEIAYGLERLAMCLQDIDDVYHIQYDSFGTTYGEIYGMYEKHFGEVAFNVYSREYLLEQISLFQQQITHLLGEKHYMVAYDFALKQSHCLNFLESRGYISNAEKAEFIFLIRNNIVDCLKLYKEFLTRGNNG